MHHYHVGQASVFSAACRFERKKTSAEESVYWGRGKGGEIWHHTSALFCYGFGQTEDFGWLSRGSLIHIPPFFYY